MADLDWENCAMVSAPPWREALRRGMKRRVGWAVPANRQEPMFAARMVKQARLRSPWSKGSLRPLHGRDAGSSPAGGMVLWERNQARRQDDRRDCYADRAQGVP